MQKHAPKRKNPRSRSRSRKSRSPGRRSPARGAGEPLNIVDQEAEGKAEPDNFGTTTFGDTLVNIKINEMNEDLKFPDQPEEPIGSRSNADLGALLSRLVVAYDENDNKNCDQNDNMKPIWAKKHFRQQLHDAFKPTVCAMMACDFGVSKFLKDNADNKTLEKFDVKPFSSQKSNYKSSKSMATSKMNTRKLKDDGLEEEDFDEIWEREKRMHQYIYEF